MADVICIVAFRTDTDRAVRYRKIPVLREGIEARIAFDKVATELLRAWRDNKADFVSIRFIRQPKSEGERG